MHKTAIIDTCARQRGGLELNEAEGAYGRAMGTKSRAPQLQCSLRIPAPSWARRSPAPLVRRSSGSGGGFGAMLENPKVVPMARPYASSRRALEGVVRAESDRERVIDDPTSAPRPLQRQEALMSTGSGKYIEPSTDASVGCIDFFPLRHVYVPC